MVSRTSIENNTKNKLEKVINLFSNAKYIYLKAVMSNFGLNDFLVVMSFKNNELYGIKKDKSIKISICPVRLS